MMFEELERLIEGARKVLFPQAPEVDPTVAALEPLLMEHDLAA